MTLQVHVSTLPNGIRVVTDTVRQVETVSLGIWVGVGTRHEAPALNGVAHLVEHMLFKGTPRRNALAISEQIESVGGHLNAYTTREQTAYYAKMLKQDTGLALDVLADMLQHSLLDTAELDRERTVILQEIGQSQDTPDDIIYDHAQTVAFPQQSIGRPILGQADVIRTVSRASLTDYLKQNYGGERLVITAAGNIEHTAFVDMVQAAFAAVPAKASLRTDPSRYAGGEHREERDLEQLHLILGFLGAAHGTTDYYTQAVLSTLLGGGMSSRLFQEVREKRGLVYSIHTFSSAFTDGGFFGVYAGTGPEHVKELVPVVCDELLKVADTLTDSEIARAKAQIKAGILMGLESTMHRAEHWAQQLLVFNRLILPEETIKKIDAVEKADLARLAKKITQSRLTLAALGPVKELPAYDTIEGLLRR